MSILPRTVPPKKLAQSISSVQLTMKLNNILDWDGVTDLAAGDFGTQLFAVLSNSTKTQIEIVEIDPATIAATSITLLNRGLSYDGSQTVVAGNALAWPANDTTVQLGSDVPQLIENFIDKDRAQTITGVKTFTQFPIKSGGLTPTAAGELATKQYVDDQALGTTIVDGVLASGTAGEAVTAGQVVYFKEADQKWWLADADVAATVDGSKLGIAQIPAIANDPVTVLIHGTDKNQSGLTLGAKCYIGNTPGSITHTPGTIARFVGWAKTTTQILWSVESDLYRPSSTEKEALAGTAGIPSTTNKYVTNDDTYGVGLIPRGGPFMTEYSFGTGLDGDYTLDGTQAAVSGLFSKAGNIYTLLRDANFDDLTINNGVTLQPAGYRIYVNGTLTNNGVIERNGANGAAGVNSGLYSGSGAAAGGAGGSIPAGTLSGHSGTNGGSSSIYSGAGGNGGAATGTYVLANILGAVGGSSGNTGGGPGSGGATTNIVDAITYSILQYAIGWTQAVEFSAGTRWLTALSAAVGGTALGAAIGRSTGGGGGSSNINFIVNGNYPAGGSGGGAGSSGGTIYIAARNFINSATGVIRSTGGNGGKGGDGVSNSYGAVAGGGGGGGGNGGVIVILYSTYSQLGTFTLTAGTGGVGGTGYIQTNVGVSGSPGAAGNAGTYFRVKL